MVDGLPAVRSSVRIVATLLLLFNGVTISAAEIVVESVRPSENTGAITRYGLTRDDLQRISSTLPGVQRVVPERAMSAAAVYGDHIVSLELIGTVADYGRLGKVTLRQGRFLLPKDVDNRNNIAVVDTITAERLFPDRQAIGKNIRISNHYFLIVGIFEPERDTSRTRQKMPRGGCAFVPLTTMRSRYGDVAIQTRNGNVQIDRYELTRIRVALTNATALNRASEVVTSLLRKQHKTQDFSVHAVTTSVRK